MPLDPSILKSGLSVVFRAKTMPADVPTALSIWNDAYTVYASTALAGPAAHSPFQVSLVESADFFSSLEMMFRSAWMTTVWVGPGVSGATANVPPLLQPLKAIGLSRTRDPDEAISSIVDVIHTYTLGITVVLTTPTGVSTVVQLA